MGLDQGSFLLHSKLHPPAINADSVVRGGLIDALDRCRSGLLCLLRSPAGFGKTTLLAQYHEWLARDGAAVAWLSLDEDDRNAERFIAYLNTALRRALDSDAALPALLNLLSAQGPPVFIFLDDYHLAQTSGNDRIIEWLIRHQPQRLRLIVAMRGRPTFPVARLRAQGKLIELDEEDLRFRSQDATSLFGEGLEAACRDKLLMRTEGWPAALQLARLWTKRHGSTPSAAMDFTGSATEMAAYLAEEVVANLPASYRDLLLATSIVGDVPLDLAQHLTGGVATREMLADLVAMNVPLFALPGQEDRFRYHPIFREFLAAQLAMSDRHDRRVLHRRASDWFLARQQLVHAIHHAIAAGEDDRALQLASEVSWMRQISCGDLNVVRQVLDMLPCETIRWHPSLAAGRAFLKFKEGSIKSGAFMLRDLRALFPPGSTALTAYGDATAQDLHMLDALHEIYVDQGLPHNVIPPLQEILSSAATADYSYRGSLTTILGLLYFRDGQLENASASFLASMEEFDSGKLRYGCAFIPTHLAMIAIAQGKLKEAEQYIAAGDDIIRLHSPFDPALRHQLDLIAAELYYLVGDLSRAKSCLSVAMTAIEQAEGWTELYISAYRTAAAIAFIEKGIEAACAQLDAGEEVARRFDYPRLASSLSTTRVRLFVIAGDLASAAEAAKTGRLKAIAALSNHRDAGWQEQDEALASLARLAIARGETEEALRRLSALERHCQVHGAGLWQVRHHILLAVTLRKSGQLDRAVESMRQALSATMTENLLRPFIDEGAAVRELLKETVAQIGVGAMTEELYGWISRLLLAFSQGQVSQRDGGSDGSCDPVSAAIFTQAELNVLQQLQAGGSNKEIARRMATSENTVKFHMKSIFKKLGVNTRRLAVEVARQSALLPQ